MAAIPVGRTSTILSPALRIRSQSRVKTKVRVLPATGVFALFALLGYCGASLAGSVLAESARRQSIEAVARVKAARAAEANLQRRLDALRGLASIDAWASQNGFVASDRSLQTSVRPNDAKPQL